MNQHIVIVGAGLAGLIAAHAWPQASLVERMPKPTVNHRALLRFRTDAVSRLTGIPFRKVTVRKGIYHNGSFHEPNVRFANWYAEKCTGAIIGDRSIWNIEAVERYIAPYDFYEQLLFTVGSRIRWGTIFEQPKDPGGIGFAPVVSTAPLPETLKLLVGDQSPDWHGVTFARAPITVRRYLLPADWDVHQTVYYPSPDHQMYRASITGNLLICEHAGEVDEQDAANGLLLATSSMGLGPLQRAAPMEVTGHRQQYGKITPIDDSLRKQLLFRLTHERNIYSLGRFATWRNILLDDVVGDIDVVKRLMRSGSHYDLRHSS